jgi:hypothetical protein
MDSASLSRERSPKTNLAMVLTGLPGWRKGRGIDASEIYRELPLTPDGTGHLVTVHRQLARESASPDLESEHVSGHLSFERS